MSTTGGSSGTGKSLVSSAERTGFADAVLAGKLEPDFAAVAYHFEGWLDKGAGCLGGRSCATPPPYVTPFLARDINSAL